MKYFWEILMVIGIVAFIGIFIFTNTVMYNGDAEGWSGSDNVGASVILENNNYTPWIENADYTFVPPSGEIESCLFALQAAFGGLLIGWVFGGWTTERRMKKNNVNRQN